MRAQRIPFTRDRDQANPFSGKYARTRDCSHVEADFLKREKSWSRFFRLKESESSHCKDSKPKVQSELLADVKELLLSYQRGLK